MVAVLIGLGGFLLLRGKTSESFGEKASGCKNIAGEAVVVMKDETYEPADVTIKPCEKVIFKNSTSSPRWPASNIHPTHGIYPEFDPKEPVEPGKEWSFMFDKIGQWRYHDHLVPSIRGTIVVSQ